MNFIEEKEQEYKDNIERLEDDLHGILQSLKKSKQFGDWYEEVIDGAHDLTDGDIIDMYMHNFQTYLDRKQMLEEYRSDYAEFRELKDDPTFRKEYERLLKVSKRLNEKTNEVFMRTKRTNFIIVLPRNHEDWFTMDYIKERWANRLQSREVVVSKDRLFPTVEIIELGGSLKFSQTNPDDEIPELKLDITPEYQQSVIHELDLSDIIKEED